MSDQQIKYRSVIEFLSLERQTAKQIFDRMLIVFGDSSPFLATIYNWINKFRTEKKSAKNEPIPGRLKSVVNDEMLQNLEKLVMTNRRLKLDEIAAEMDIPETTIYFALTNELGMKKVSA